MSGHEPPATVTPASAARSSAHRPDIQGLRAIAVIVVIAFHAGLPLPGGFVGVDVFFAISGFVITAMLAREWARTGTINLRQFYLRRFRRLTPALVVMLGVVMVATSLLLDPFGVQQVAAQTAFGAVALCANVVIALISGDYFAIDAEANPLLHTWSLSVEEQFYLIFPALLVLGWWLGRRFRRPGLGALGMVVLLTAASAALIRGAGFGIAAQSWTIGYYSPFNRAWEFGAGALLALVMAQVAKLPRWLALPVTLSGAGLMAISLWFINTHTPFPGKWTVAPIAAAVLLIAGGIIGPNPVTRVLGTRPMVLIGDWSYSLYLWHWPCIVVAAALWPGDVRVRQVAALVSFVPALLSYYWVEQPFRTGALAARQVVLRLAAMLVSGALLAGTCWLVADRVWRPAFLSGALPAGHPQVQQAPVDSFPCHFPAISALTNNNGDCLQSVETGDPQVALLGDSHAEHLYSGLVEALPGVNVGVYSFRAPMMMGTQERLDAYLAPLAATARLRTVVISRYWTRGSLSREDEVAPLDHAVALLRAAGKNVIVTDDVPSMGRGPFACIYRVAPIVGVSACTTSALDFLAAHARYEPQLRKVVDAHPGTLLFASAPLFCDAQVCSSLKDGDALFTDDNHLTPAGSRIVAQAMMADPLVRPLLVG